jgi:hypothetical protein
MGYDPVLPSTPNTFESASIILQAKKTLAEWGFPQAIAHMVRIQHQHMRLGKPTRIIDTTYSILPDSIQWQFLRFGGRRLQISSYLSSLSSASRCTIY